MVASMRTKGPLILGLFAGLIGFSELYITWEPFRAIPALFSDFAIILSAIAFILGGINIIQVNWPKVRRQEEDWQFKVVLLVSAFVMSVVGIAWHEIGATPDHGSWNKQANQTQSNDVMLNIHADKKDALVIINGGTPYRAWHNGTPSDIALPPGDTPLSLPINEGTHNVLIRMPVSAGYQEYKTEIQANVGDVIDVNAPLALKWGQDGRVFTWIYDHIFFPCNATMFALLAFFIASAAFRAFRARNIESALLLSAAILVMIGLVPIGRAISPVFPELEEWIMSVLNTAGRRAIMMGAALGGIATGLRIILGIERSHLGSD